MIHVIVQCTSEKIFLITFSRWSSTCWKIFRCSAALVWGGCTYTGHFWSPGLPEKFIWFLLMTSNLAGCTLLNGCFVEWTYAQFTKCCSPKKMASSILTEASLPAQISGLWHQVLMLYICTPVWVEQCSSRNISLSHFQVLFSPKNRPSISGPTCHLHYLHPPLHPHQHILHLVHCLGDSVPG